MDTWTGAKKLLLDGSLFTKYFVLTFVFLIILGIISIFTFEIFKDSLDGSKTNISDAASLILIENGIHLLNNINTSLLSSIDSSKAITNNSVIDGNAFPYGDTIVTLFTDLHCLKINDNYKHIMEPKISSKHRNDSQPSLPFVQKWRHLLIAGLYDTGTNALQTFFFKNCLSNQASGFDKIEYQVPWKKHSLVSLSEINENIESLKYNLGIVIVKDPLTWIKSICKAKYYIRVKNRTWYQNDCPQYIEQSKIIWHDSNYDSLIHLWNEWYSAYVDIALMPFKIDLNIKYSYFPMILVRFEDLLFNSNQLLELVCDGCVNGKSKNEKKINYIEKAVKYHGQSRSRSEALDTYSKTEYRYKGFNKEDLIYIKNHVNHTLLKLFKYEFDVNGYKLNNGIYGLDKKDLNPMYQGDNPSKKNFVKD